MAFAFYSFSGIAKARVPHPFPRFLAEMGGIAITLYLPDQ
jgi:hypothetical protein